MSFLLTLRNYQLRLGQNIAKQRGSKRLQLTTAGWQLAPRFPQKWENEGPRLRIADLDLDTWISNIQIESVNGAPCSNNRNKTWKIKQKASEGCISKKGNVFTYLCNRYGYQKHTKSSSSMLKQNQDQWSENNTTKAQKANSEQHHRPCPHTTLPVDMPYLD